MNLANKLTMLRVLMIPVFVVILYLEFTYSIYVAMTVFILATLTDLADGYVARKKNLITDFGKFMDPLADKVLTFAALLWFIEVGLIPAWLVLIVVLREFMVTGMRLVASSKGRVVAAGVSGKIKTLVGNLCIIAMFLPLLDWMLIVCWVLIGVTTVVSGVEYFVKNKDIMKMDM
ncbi:MAG: CDP-diacylglycerol--glycerol-3-phosphate 3-phosphatidyltransferase [Oscillospiraceae bacterium]|nr:CDP-diacylglycerol--glycerol-3-phosphate 3-phosphatidyltransferase [Oscillospiraceae bacterium]